MLIRIFSDLHTEFAPFDFAPLPEDKDTVCVLAGDIGVVNKPAGLIDVLQKACGRFRHVVYVFGNHEFYSGGVISTAHAILEDMIGAFHLYNLSILENETLIVDDVAFIGATLWTDYNKNNPRDIMLAMQCMNDYRHIWRDAGGPRIVTDDLYKLHTGAKKFIFDQVKVHKELGRKTVVVVHHGVCEMSVSEEFKGDPVNSSFYSELSPQIFETQPDVIIHGHMHRARHYMIDNTKVFVNPLGYPGERSGFNPTLRIEV